MKSLSSESLHWRIVPGDSVEYSFISRKCVVTLVRAARGLDERIHPRRHPCVRPRLQSRTARSVGSIPRKQKTDETNCYAHAYTQQPVNLQLLDCC